jgi:hypothetical protein
MPIQSAISRPARFWRDQPAAQRTSLVIRTISDLRALAVSPRRVKRLPPEGVVIDIPGLDLGMRNEIRRHIAKYARSCGCAQGGATFILAGVACVVTAVHLARQRDWVDCVRVMATGVIAVPLLTAAAKYLGMQSARLRFTQACERLIESIATPPAQFQECSE